MAFYSDKHSVFRVNKPDAKGGSGMTQFGRALAELNIEIICANSSQAKGRVERANRTLQDRLVKELRLENVCDMDAGNAFLPEFLCALSTSTSPCSRSEPEDLHRSLNVAGSRLNEILCHREQRHVSEQLSSAYDRKQIILERSEVAEELGGKYVDLYHFPDRPAGGAMEGCLASLSCLRQGPARQPHGRRREQAARPRAVARSRRSRISSTSPRSRPTAKRRLQEATTQSLWTRLRRTERAAGRSGGNDGLMERMER